MQCLCVITHLQARYARRSVRGQGSGAEVSAQQRVEWGTAGGVGCLPVRLKILSQVLTCVFQLILIQDDVKHLLLKRSTYAKPYHTQTHTTMLKVRKTGISFTGVLMFACTRRRTGGHCASLSAATSCTLRCLLCDFPLDLMSRWRTYRTDELVTRQDQSDFDWSFSSETLKP